MYCFTTTNEEDVDRLCQLYLQDRPCQWFERLFVETCNDLGYKPIGLDEFLEVNPAPLVADVLKCLPVNHRVAVLLIYAPKCQLILPV